MTSTKKNPTRRFAANRVPRETVASRVSLHDIERRRILSSRRRLVVSGDTYELYSYERPYFYNRSPEKKPASGTANTSGNERRADNLSQARARIRRLISANESAYEERLKFVTFTFAKNVRDLSTANKLWAEYARKMRERHGALKYLTVVEFQKRGAIHYHVLYFNLPFIYGVKEVLAKTWGHGFVNIQTVAHVRNLGAYVSKYLQKDIMDRRLVGEKAFFCSKGLVQPEEFRNESSIDKILAEFSMSSEVVRDYTSSHFGAIKYIQGKLT